MLNVWILGDQLIDPHPALQNAAARVGRDNVRVLMIESTARLRTLPYHRKKLVLLLSAMRHYAERLRAQGWTVDYRTAATYDAAFDDIDATTVLTMAASGRGARALQARRGFEVLPNTQFLCGQYDPHPDPDPSRRYLFEHFYRRMRTHFGVLLTETGEPVGGRWNYDEENRNPLPKGTRIPLPVSFAPDAITEQVMREVAEMPGVGSVDGFDLAVTAEEAQGAFEDFVRHRLALFGPYEDAMTERDDVLFHSKLSPYINIGLLAPMPLVTATERLYREGKVPLSSAEGFIRQVMGWREYIWWQYWRLGEKMQGMNHLDAQRPLPTWFWTGNTRMRCLRTVIERTLRTGWNHHIERLMILSSFSVLAGLDPVEVNRWFMSMFIDAYEWVMVPNVFGMGLHADGGLTATKPYVSAGAYIKRMSDFCTGCAYDVKARDTDNACPFNSLFWSFLMRNEEGFRKNMRMQPMMRGLSRFTPAQAQATQQRAEALLEGIETI